MRGGGPTFRILNWCEKDFAWLRPGWDFGISWLWSFKTVEIKWITRKCEHPVLKRIGFCRRLTPKRCSWGAPQVDFWVQGQLIYALLSPSTFKYDFWSNNSDSRALLCTLSLIRLKENASEELLSPWRACRCGAGPRARRSTPQRRRRCIIRSLGSPDV